MDILEYRKYIITVFDGNITAPPPSGFVIYGDAGKHMLAYVDEGKIITLNNAPYKNLNLTVKALKSLIDEQPLWTR